MKTSASAFFVATSCVAAVSFASSASAGTMLTKPRYAIIENLKVAPDNGGISPDAFAYHVEGRIFAGNNPCQARGVRVGLRTRTQSGVIHVLPYRQAHMAGLGGRPICYDLYAPVYRDVALTVRGLSSRTSDVVVHSVGTLGNDLSVRTLLAPEVTGAAAPSAAVTLSGVFTRVMGAGGESTGLGLQLADGRLVEVDVPAQVLQSIPGEQGALDTLDGQTVAVTGHYETRNGVEIPLRQVLVVDALTIVAAMAP